MDNKTLEALAQILEDAGTFLLQQTVQVAAHKSANDLLTENDLKTEQFLLERIQALLPEANIISEETCAENGLSGCSVVVDPIDGTCNYAVGSDLFGIQIAVFEEEVCVAALLHFPLQRQTIWATLGGGAYCNGRRLQVNTQASSGDGVLLISDYYSNIFVPMDQQFELVKQLQPVFLKTRHLGAACVDFTSLAKGQALAYICYYSYIWDIAPGLLVAQEAGCCHCALDTGAYRYGNPGLVVANNRENLSVITDLYKKICGV